MKHLEEAYSGQQPARDAPGAEQQLGAQGSMKVKIRFRCVVCVVFPLYQGMTFNLWARLGSPWVLVFADYLANSFQSYRAIRQWDGCYIAVPGNASQIS